MANDDKQKPISGKPMNPNTDYQDMMVDTRGWTGITTDHKDPGNKMPIPDQQQVIPKADGHKIDPNIKASTKRRQMARDTVRLDEIATMEGGNDTLRKSAQPSVLGQQSVSGTLPDPESDDDTLLNSHQVGLRLNEDSEHPKELNIADDVAAAEEHRRTH